MSEQDHSAAAAVPGAANRLRRWKCYIGRTLRLAFQDSVLEDDFQAIYWHSRRRLMWMGCVVGFVWTCVMCTSGYLQIFKPHIYELCCDKVHHLEFGQSEFIALVLQLPFPLVGVVIISSSSASSIFTRAVYFVCGWDAGVLQTDTSAADAAILRLILGTTVFCILPSGLFLLVATEFQILGVQGQLQWVLSCFGTILHLLFLPHLIWVAASFAVASISVIYTLASRPGSCVGAVLFQVVWG
jgi:hypothetical protein